MSMTWVPEDEPAPVKITPAGWVRVVLRGGILTMILLIGVLLTLILRPLEAWRHGLYRPWTPHITQAVSRLAFIVLGIRHEAVGERMNRPGAVVANHVSWLDIFTLNARKRIYFVAKSEVAGWPGIGFLARMVGTVFINRDRKEAKKQQEILQSRLLAGHKLLFFPEGTSTDGLRVLRFRSTLFQAFFASELRHELWIQPATTIYFAPPNQDARFYGWWGDMDLAPHLLKLLAAWPQGSAKIVYHQPVKVDDFADRKALAAHVEGIVRGGMPPERQIGE